jgi:hypothetical protein
VVLIYVPFNDRQDGIDRISRQVSKGRRRAWKQCVHAESRRLQRHAVGPLYILLCFGCLPWLFLSLQRRACRPYTQLESRSFECLSLGLAVPCIPFIEIPPTRKHANRTCPSGSTWISLPGVKYSGCNRLSGASDPLKDVRSGLESATFPRGSRKTLTC